MAFIQVRIREDGFWEFRYPDLEHRKQWKKLAGSKHMTYVKVCQYFHANDTVQNISPNIK